MHSWASDEPSILNDIEMNSELKKLLDNESDTYGEKVLGLKWVDKTDELTFSVNTHKISKEIYSGQTRPTKREFLAVICPYLIPLDFSRLSQSNREF